MSEPRPLAALDLGSNSFHLVVAHVVDGEVQVVDKLRERVRLAAGLDDENMLTEDAQQRAIDFLEQVGERLEALGPKQVRAVGTNTLRKARNGPAFLQKANAALGHPIEIISGHEEARLVYLGVSAQTQEGDGGRRLVIDIGGGSTECIIGVGPSILRADSLFMGCVSFTRRFFDEGRITPRKLEKAMVAARLECGPIHRPYKTLGWAQAFGSSGTIRAIQSVLTASGWADHCVTLEGLERLGEALCDAGRVSELKLPDLKPERAEVLPGGYAILRAVLRSLGVERLVASKGALREGVLHDMVGRHEARDAREDTVLRMAERYRVDARQARRVEETALALLGQVAGPWNLPLDTSARLLRWAARLHEIGTSISYTGHHKHGAYLIHHSDMPGFSRGEQSMLAALVLAQRRRLVDERFKELAGARRDEVLRLAVLLRLGVRINRTRSPNPRPPIELLASADQVHLSFPDGWLDSRPLSRADFEDEAARFQQAGLTLSWS